VVGVKSDLKDCSAPCKDLVFCFSPNNLTGFGAITWVGPFFAAKEKI
jgi:hypothetical protein